MSEDASEGEGEALDEALLRAPLARAESRPTSRWAYSRVGIALVSAFIAYHATILLLWVFPNAGFIKEFRLQALEGSHAVSYFEATRNTQGWAMFAPDPTRANVFMRVLVTDQHGDIWDLEHDMWGKDRWPYIWYDRNGKVNRRIDAKKGYQRIYAGWVCRQWEREHAGEVAKSVQFVRRWSRVPSRKQVFENGGWDAWDAPYQDFDQNTFRCATLVDGQLPNELRARYGLAPIDESELRRVKFETWSTEHEEVERETKRDAARAKWKDMVREQKRKQERDKTP